MLPPAPPSHLAALSLAGCAPLSRGYQVTLENTTPAHPRRISKRASDWRPWMVLLQRGGKPDHFLLLRFFDWTPRSRDIDCKSLVKNLLIVGGILNCRRAPTFGVGRPLFSDFSAWRTGTTAGTVRERPPPIYAGRRAAVLHSAITPRRSIIFNNTCEDKTESATVDFARPKQ